MYKFYNLLISLFTKEADRIVVNIQTPYEIFIYVEGGISDPNLKAG